MKEYETVTYNRDRRLNNTIVFDNTIRNQMQQFEND
jgi:hypothetical protein